MRAVEFGAFRDTREPSRRQIVALLTTLHNRLEAALDQRSFDWMEPDKLLAAADKVRRQRLELDAQLHIPDDPLPPEPGAHPSPLPPSEPPLIPPSAGPAPLPPALPPSPEEPLPASIPVHPPAVSNALPASPSE